MKHMLLQLVILLVLFNGWSYSQDCSTSPLFKQGKQFVFLDEISSSSTAVSARTSKRIYMIDSVNKQGGGLHASIKELGSGQDGQNDSPKKNASESHFTGIICDGRSISYVTSVKSASVNFVIVSDFPIGMKVGDKFKDQVINLNKGADKKNNIPDITVFIHRSVVGEEVLTTVAGKWKCYKIAETTTSVISGKNGQPPTSINNPDTNYTWFSADIGIVKMSMGNLRTLTLVGLP